MPVRYSIRTHPQETSAGESTTLERKILNNQLDFEYKPSCIESMFKMDEKTQEIQKLLKQRFQSELQSEDIQEVIHAEELAKDFRLIRIKEECREKFGGHEIVAASLKRLSLSPTKRDEQMQQAMELLMNKKQMREIIFTNASQDAIDSLLNNEL